MSESRNRLDNLVSVIVPSFNSGPFLAKAVDSILDQSHRELELVVVDDGSNDGSTRFIEENKDPRVRLIRQDNNGAARARNRGLEEAKGEYIQFLDADDLLAPDKIGMQVAVMKSHPGTELVAGAWGRFHGADLSGANFIADALWTSMDPVSWQTLALENDLMMHPGAWLASRELIDRAGAWDASLSLNDDGEFFARAMLHTKAVAFCPAAKSYYRSGDVSSLSGSRSKAAWDSAVRAMDSIRDGLLGRENNGQTRTALATAYSRLAVLAYPYDWNSFQRASGSARALGGFRPCFSGGKVGQALTRFLGWKITRRLQAVSYGMGYQRFGHRRRAR